MQEIVDSPLVQHPLLVTRHHARHHMATVQHDKWTVAAVLELTEHVVHLGDNITRIRDIETRVRARIKDRNRGSMLST